MTRACSASTAAASRSAVSSGEPTAAAALRPGGSEKEKAGSGGADGATVKCDGDQELRGGVGRGSGSSGGGGGAEGTGMASRCKGTHSALPLSSVWQPASRTAAAVCAPASLRRLSGSGSTLAASLRPGASAAAPLLPPERRAGGEEDGERGWEGRCGRCAVSLRGDTCANGDARRLRAAAAPSLRRPTASSSLLLLCASARCAADSGDCRASRAGSGAVRRGKVCEDRPTSATSSLSPRTMT